MTLYRNDIFHQLTARPAIGADAADFPEGEYPSIQARGPQHWLKLATAIVEESSRESQADGVLRQNLQNSGGISIE